MDPQTLPAREKALYDKVKEQLKVAFEPLKVGQYRINLLRCTDLEQVLDGKDPLKNVSEFPLWIRLWEAGIVLADFFAAQKPKPGTTMLELGAGLGVTGLIASAAGYSVTLSDFEQRVLDFQRISAAASNVTDVKIEHLDWFEPKDIGQFDIIAGSEILHREDFFEPLLNIFKTALRPDGTVFLAHDASRRNIAPFFELAQSDFKVQVAKKRLKSLDGDKDILVARLKRI